MPVHGGDGKIGMVKTDAQTPKKRTKYIDTDDIIHEWTGNEWRVYDPERKKKKLDEIIQELIHFDTENMYFPAHPELQDIILKLVKFKQEEL